MWMERSGGEVVARFHPFTPRPTSSSFLSFEFREVLVRVGVKGKFWMSDDM